MAGPKQTIFVGDVFPTKSCGEIIVTEYRSCNEITVKFLDGNSRVTNSAQIRNGLIKNNLKPLKFGIGFTGSLTTHENVKKNPAYCCWAGLLRRCYDKDFQSKHPAYIGCYVTEEWHNFQNFAIWYNEQKTYSEKLFLDKDLKVIGNRVYSPETCTLVPREVNNLLERRENGRGEYPIGVHWDKINEKFTAQCHRGNKCTYIGQYNTVEDAFNAYKVVKEKYVKTIAEKHKMILHEDVYNYLMNFTVSIDD